MSTDISTYEKNKAFQLETGEYAHISIQWLGISYAEKPLPLLEAKDGTYELTRSELEEKIKVPLDQDIWAEKKLLEQKYTPDIQKKLSHESISRADLDEFFYTNHRITICNMGDLGHGIFASKEIQAGEKIGFYAGKIRTKFHDSASDPAACFSITGTELQFDPYGSRSLLSFMQHLPLEETLNEFEFKNEEVRNKVQTANIVLKIHAVSITPTLQVPAITAYSSRKIFPKEQIGYSYGSNVYWLHMGSEPEYFFKDGTVVPREYYRQTKVQVAAEDKAYDFTVHQGIFDNVNQRLWTPIFDWNNRVIAKIPPETLLPRLRIMNCISLIYDGGCGVLKEPVALNHLTKTQAMKLTLSEKSELELLDQKGDTIKSLTVPHESQFAFKVLQKDLEENLTAKKKPGGLLTLYKVRQSYLKTLSKETPTEGLGYFCDLLKVKQEDVLNQAPEEKKTSFKTKMS